jgi:hypothetical protein
MKTSPIKRVLLFLACLFLMQPMFSQSTGRVVINEYMPWTSNGCGTTAEFIELLNFGPGAVDIGCYIITTGQYSITIPSNTILQPGEFYVLAGQDFIPDDCANIDSTNKGVHADLNWNACKCTNAPIPTSGDGLMTDGGTSNTPLILFDPNLIIIDAVVRSLPAEPSTVLNSSTIGVKCRMKTFDIGMMPVVYEELGMSAGRGNSFARTTDGDCGWVKDSRQSANASNNRKGDVSDITYSFSLINAFSCDSTGGKVDIHVEHSNYGAVFPMSYTVAIDINNDGLFDINDEYTTFIDSTPPSIEASGLPIGHYRITVSSVKGCYLKTFEFSIFTCTQVLPVRLDYFKHIGQKDGRHQLQWKLQGIENLQRTSLQKAKRSNEFITDKIIDGSTAGSGEKIFFTDVAADDSYKYFRLMIITKSGEIFYSPVVYAKSYFSENKIWPNPVMDNINLQLTSASLKTISYSVYNTTGKAVQKGSLLINKGQTLSTLDVERLMPGVYQLHLSSFTEDNQPISFRFVKH